MKKTLIIAALALAGCNRPDQQKIEKLVTSYVGSTLNDPGSYQNVNFGRTDTIFSSWDQSTPEGRRLDTLAAAYSDSAAVYTNSYHSVMLSSKLHGPALMDQFNAKAIAFKKESDSVEAIIQQKGQHYKGSLIAYSIKHTYEAKNESGAIITQTKWFQVDPGLKKVDCCFAGAYTTDSKIKSAALE